MTCTECRDLILEVARRRSAPCIERAVGAHAEGCLGCASLLAREVEVTSALLALGREERTSQPAARVEAELMAAFSLRYPRELLPPPRTTGIVRRWLPVAAAIVLGVGSGLWWLATRSPIADPRPGSVQFDAASAPIVRTETAQPDSPRAPAVGVDGEPASAPAPIRRPTRSRPPRLIEPVGFAAIPGSAGLPAFESGEIVRVGIDVTALPSYGIEIPSGAQSAIEADLLIGQDGHARAIRLVGANFEEQRPLR